MYVHVNISAREPVTHMHYFYILWVVTESCGTSVLGHTNMGTQHNASVSGRKMNQSNRFPPDLLHDTRQS